MADISGHARGHLLPLAFKTVSLITIYTTYGILQERIVKGNYNNSLENISIHDEPASDTFTSTPFLILCNRLVSFATGIVLAQIQWATANSSLLPNNISRLGQPISWHEAISEQLTRIRPSSSFFSYAVVAGLNNAATLSQYSSLSYLSFTTLTLGKSAKMLPVLILGHMWYGKRYKYRQWIGAAIVILGIWGYLTSPLSIDMKAKKEEIVPKSTFIGVGCLLAYLFFDGLTSTMQERLFGQAKRGEETSSLLGMTPGIIDQMIWVNLFSSIIALWLLSFSPVDQTISSLKLVLVSPTLQLHIVILSLTATAGLLVLFNVISVHGALIASLIMTVRQFVSIVCNAAWFGNIAAIPLSGWAGIGFMAAGIWIKMDRQYDERDGRDLAVPEIKIGESVLLNARATKRAHSLAWQYGLPLVVCPLTFVVLIASIEFLSQPTPAIVDAIWGINS